MANVERPIPTDTLGASVRAILPRIIDVYKDVHEHPELSLQETRTAANVADFLRSLQVYEVATGIGKTGVVGILRNGDGPTIALRADMDALPVEEKTGLPYASHVRATDQDGNEVPVMHACGHDVHTAALLGAAQVLAEQRQYWHGTLMLIFQPAEETGEGARGMLRDGIFQRFPKPDLLLGQHDGPFPAGMLGHAWGISGMACTNYQVRIFGRGGHGAMPSVTIDPIVIAASAIMRLQTIVSREIHAMYIPVVSVGSIHSGSKANIIPDEATLQLTLRCKDDKVMKQIEEAVQRIITLEAQIARAPREPEFVVLDRVPALVNDKALTDRVFAAHRKYFGEQRVQEAPGGMQGASEDFGEFGIAGHESFDGPNIPYCYWLVGATGVDTWQAATGNTLIEKAMSVPGPHSPFFAPDPVPTLNTAIEALTVAALDLLQ